MNTPDPLWQFWTNWTITALGTLATFLAVLVALFGARLRRWISPPHLSIRLSNAEGMRGSISTFDPETNKATYKTSAIWYHVQVENKTREAPITGVHIFLLSIEAPDAAGAFKPVWEGHAPLGWRHEADPTPKTIGYPAECDLCHVLKEPLEVRLSPIIKGQVLDTITGAFKFAFTLQARGIEAESKPLRLEISWSGMWSDNKADMMRHLVVKQV